MCLLVRTDGRDFNMLSLECGVWVLPKKEPRASWQDKAVMMTHVSCHLTPDTYQALTEPTATASVTETASKNIKMSFGFTLVFIPVKLTLNCFYVY